MCKNRIFFNVKMCRQKVIRKEASVVIFTRTVRDIIKRFDVLYQNAIPFDKKAEYLYAFEKNMFPADYLSRSGDQSVNKFLDGPSHIAFPFDDLYIKALLVFYYGFLCDGVRLAEHAALLADAVYTYRLHRI